MRTEQLQTTLLSPPDFSDYRGGDSFTLNGKYFQKKAGPLGQGVHGEVFCFEANDHTKVAVKIEKPYMGQYWSGDSFQKEAAFYQKIYGLGIFSGDSEDLGSPHCILMPYFSGKTLNHISCATLYDLLFYWIKTAEAIQTFHTKYLVVHADLKPDNIIVDPNKKIFPIDFGWMMGQHEKREVSLSDTKFNRDAFRQYPPEFFTGKTKTISPHSSIDVYALGILLYELYAKFLELCLFTQPSAHVTETILDAQKNLTQYDPRERWPIAKAIYLLASLFFSQVPRATWIAYMPDRKLERLTHTTLMQTLWREACTITIAVRVNELMDEQEALDAAKKPSQRKAQKIDGLRALHSDIQIKNPEQFGAIVSKTKKTFPELTAGVFSRRTKTLLNELAYAAPVFH